jgi:hypothetical protein
MQANSLGKKKRQKPERKTRLWLLCGRKFLKRSPADLLHEGHFQLLWLPEMK